MPGVFPIRNHRPGGVKSVNHVPLVDRVLQPPFGWPQPFDEGLQLSIVADAFNVNLFTLAGSPLGPVNVTLTIKPGVRIGSTSTAAAALTIGAFPAGSSIRIVNFGTIQGRGGNGGAGGATSSQPGAPGNVGGHAIEASGKSIVVNNSNGSIWGGGGGGAGGTAGADYPPDPYVPYGSPGGAGGHGGGGAGYNPGTGPADGTTTAGGAGQPGTSGMTGPGETGGNGGGPGQAGASTSGAAGGAAGKAIDLSGGSVIFEGGNSDPQVKGAVS